MNAGPTIVKSTGSLTASYPTPSSSVGRMFLDRVAATPSREAFRAPEHGGGWRSMSWKDVDAEVSELAAGLVALGVGVEERVGIACSTRLEWVLADTAVMCAGAATTTVYPSTQAEDIGYILGDSGTRVLFAEDQSQVDKVESERANLPDLMAIVLIDGEGDGERVLSWAQLREKGRAQLAENPEVIVGRVDATGPDSLATLIYTSGTTGKPKGVELTHRCWAYEGAAIEQLGILTPDDVHFLWLPLAHSFGKVLLSAQLQIGFSTAVDGRVDHIVANLGEVRPTFMAAVPRIFEKVHAAVVRQGTAEGGVKAKIFEWAFGVGAKASAKRRAGESVGGVLGMQLSLADKLVFSKIKERLGGRIRYMVSGSAALAADIATWFDAAGLIILEGYGLTETSAATCMNRPGNVGIGTVGEPFPGTEIGIAEDGEIVIRGPGVMRGYRNRQEQTDEVMLGDGWFASGDIGEIDDRGRVRITDRKKDLVKTSGGKYIAPGAIEAQFKALCPIAANVLVVANNRNFASALVTLDPDALSAFADSKGLSTVEPAALAQDPAVIAEVQAGVDKLNAQLNRWETIKTFRILPRDLTVEDGELTPSLKLKRKVIEERYGEYVEDMYSGSGR
ncbi:MAG: long-chain fatty acid--CoA ligase [Candidatus Nanopelagicales bacterium]